MPEILLACCLSAVLAAPSESTTSTPYCAASPTEITTYEGEFWIQAVYLKYLPGLTDQKPYNPLFVDRNVDPANDEHYGRHYEETNSQLKTRVPLIDRLAVAGDDDNTVLFQLQNSYLWSEHDTLKLWPDELTPDAPPVESGPGGEVPTTLFNGFNLVGFEIDTETRDFYAHSLTCSIVKVCTPDNNTELQLRARLGDGRMSILSIFDCFSHFDQ